MVDGLIEVILIVGQPGEIQVGPARGEAEIVSLRKRDQVVGGGFALGKVPGLPVDQHQTLLHANRPGIDPPPASRVAHSLSQLTAASVSPLAWRANPTHA